MWNNHVFLNGNLTAEPVLKEIGEDKKKVCNFTLAVNSGYGDKATTDFFNCVAWGNDAKYIKDYAKTGSNLSVEGRLQTRQYENKEAKKVTVTEVVVTSAHVHFKGNKEKENS